MALESARNTSLFGEHGLERFHLAREKTNKPSESKTKTRIAQKALRLKARLFGEHGLERFHLARHVGVAQLLSWERM